MWTLILVVYVTAGLHSNPAITSVQASFDTEIACKEAGGQLKEKIMNDFRGSNGTRLSWSCVKKM